MADVEKLKTCGTWSHDNIAHIALFITFVAHGHFPRVRFVMLSCRNKQQQEAQSFTKHEYLQN